MKRCPKSFRITGIVVYRLDSLNVLSLPAFGAFGHIELHGLSFLQAAKASSLNSGEMYEDVLTVLTADEAISRDSLKLSERFDCYFRNLKLSSTFLRLRCTSSTSNFSTGAGSSVSILESAILMPSS